MVRNTKTEKVHRALRQFLAPKLRPDFAFDATPFFVGVHDGNLVARLDDVVGAAIRATSGDLVCDVAVPQLRRKLKQAVEDDGTTTKEASGVDQSIIDRVLALLEMRLTPTELSAVKQILMKPSKGSAYNPGAMTAEDARNAQIAYDARWPDAKRIKIEPSCAPAPQHHAASSPSDYAKRFPNAMRIGMA